MKKSLFIILTFILMLVGCQEKSIPVVESSDVNDKAQMEQLKLENEQMKNQIAEMEKMKDEEREAQKQAQVEQWTNTVMGFLNRKSQ